MSKNDDVRLWEGRQQVTLIAGKLVTSEEVGQLFGKVTAQAPMSVDEDKVGAEKVKPQHSGQVAHSNPIAVTAHGMHRSDCLQCRQYLGDTDITCVQDSLHTGACKHFQGSRIQLTGAVRDVCVGNHAQGYFFHVD